VRVGEGERRALTVFEDLLITGGKILPEASSGLPLFAITSDGIVEGLAFRDVSFVNELANASFEYWPEAPRSLGEGEVRVGKPLGWQGSAKSTDAKFGSTSVQISDGVLSTSLSNASDFASSTVTLSAWVKTGAADDAKLALVAGGNPETSMAESYYHSGNGQWERLIVSAVIPASAADIKIKITSASKTALVDGVMFQRGSLPTAFVPAVSDVMLANPQYLNFTADIVASASSTPGEVIIAKIPAGTFRNKMRVDQISVGLDKDAAITFSVKNGAEQILCTTTGSTCRASGSLSITPETELIISYQTNEPVDAKATVNLRYYPEP
jgi:hypothetical protein